MLIAGSLALFSYERGCAVAIDRVIDGRAVTVQEFGNGPVVVMFGDATRLAALAARVGRTHHVVLGPSSLVPEPGGPAFGRLLEALGVNAEATIVADVPTGLNVIHDLEPALDGGVRLAIVDTDRTDRGQARELLQRADGSSLDVLLISSPSGIAWAEYRGAHPRGDFSVSLLDACDRTETDACAAEAASLLNAWTEMKPIPAAGTVFQDPLRSGPGAGAPRVVVIPNGQYQAGAAIESRVQHALLSSSVSLTRRIAVGQMETTVAEFRRFVEATGYQAGEGCWHHSRQQEWEYHETTSWSKPVFPQTGEHPVTCVTEDDAEAYVAWLSAETGKHYRLPSETEFEFFNRGGRLGSYGFDAGDTSRFCANANGADRSSRLTYGYDCADGFEGTAPVGSFQPNDFALYDTSGNLWELTADCWQPGYLRSVQSLLGLLPRDGSPVRGGRCPAANHMLRGGAYISSRDNLRVEMRTAAGNRSTRVGFRVVRELP
jgi:formylglycine-generating enzyme required for sulfatase activity